jgi:hypothetical protein
LILKISTHYDIPQKLAGVLHTGLPSRMVEPGKFDLGTVDHGLWERGGEDTTAEPGQRVNVLLPVFPKVGGHGISCEDAIEQCNDKERGKNLERVDCLLSYRD